MTSLISTTGGSVTWYATAIVPANSDSRKD